MNFLKNYLESFTVTRGSEQIHPAPAKTGSVTHQYGHIARMAHLDNPYTDRMIMTAKTGYSEANIVNFAITPLSKIITSTPETKQTAHIKIGGKC
jgi:hypothetical protein